MLEVPHEELSLILRGKKTTQSVEVHPKTQARYVTLNAEGAITGILPYTLVALSSPREIAVVRIKGAVLNEITNAHGDLLFFDYMGVRNQLIEVVYTLGEVVRRHNITL